MDERQKRREEKEKGLRRDRRKESTPPKKERTYQISILLLCFLYLFVQLMITMNE